MTKIAYGTANQTITISLNSLANSASRQSDYVSNTSNLFFDALLFGQIKTGTSPSQLGKISVYVYGTSDGGTTYTGGASGSDGSYTFESTILPIKSIDSSATSNVIYDFGPVSVAQCFGGWLPAQWGVIVTNSSGAALFGSGHNIIYQGVY